MKDEERYRLLFGPYQSPQVQVGDQVIDEVRGEVTITTWSKGRIPWPCLRTEGRSAFVLYNDLARAIRQESSLAIQYWWGVGPATVHRWRKALGVLSATEGTRLLHQGWLPEKITASSAALGQRKGASLEGRAKLAQKVRARGYYHRSQRIWQPEEEALLGTMPDPAVAVKLGRSLKSVAMWRRRLNIPAFSARQDRGNNRKTVSLAADKLKAQRLKLRLSQKDVAARAGVNPAHLSQMETGFWRRTRPETLQRLAQALECQTSDITDLEAVPGTTGPNTIPSNPPNKLYERRSATDQELVPVKPPQAINRLNKMVSAPLNRPN